ncbi:metalloregulator ArsR/SmtB family transcription factor [Oceanisphaera avium]|uniref:HTH arsR-type domain-containing protein n=1 Tax=Oceanisphaera avium TaxID=1903694 RepID=A0A1Y0CWW4_9GAMM|nr:metalloregulator ArsR/SmtB family transcription factor [Oceanisphaera avium]ART79377.1 hypothetical protein CBP12_03785 [Oceanisphaera avium]
MTETTLTPLLFFKCLADDTRLTSLLLLFEYQELCVCDLQQALELSQPKVSRHLAELKKHQLLEDERRGRWVYYRLHSQLSPWARDILGTVHHQHNLYLHPYRQRITRALSCVD